MIRISECLKKKGQLGRGGPTNSEVNKANAADHEQTLVPSCFPATVAELSDRTETLWYTKPNMVLGLLQKHDLVITCVNESLFPESRTITSIFI